MKPFLHSTDPDTQKTYLLARSIAATPVSVLIEGETGTGKACLAEYIHSHSTVRPTQIMTIDFDVLRSDQIHNQLQEIHSLKQKGSITLILKNIQSLPSHSLAPLIQKINNESPHLSTTGRPSTVRFISTAQRERTSFLKSKVNQEVWRQISTVQMYMKPLHERHNDIFLWADLFVAEICQKWGWPAKSLEATAYQSLTKMTWKENLNSLKKAIERAVAISSTDRITAEEIMIPSRSESNPDGIKTLAEIEFFWIHKALQIYRNNKTQAAKHLGITPRTLNNKLKRYEGRNSE